MGRCHVESCFRTGISCAVLPPLLECPTVGLHVSPLAVPSGPEHSAPPSLPPAGNAAEAEVRGRGEEEGLLWPLLTLAGRGSELSYKWQAASDGAAAECPAQGAQRGKLIVNKWITRTCALPLCSLTSSSPPWLPSAPPPLPASVAHLPQQQHGAGALRAVAALRHKQSQRHGAVAAASSRRSRRRRRAVGLPGGC